MGGKDSLDGVETPPVDLMHFIFDRHTIGFIRLEAENLVVIIRNELDSIKLSYILHI